MPKKLITFNEPLWDEIQKYKKDFKITEDAEAIRDLIRKGLVSENYLKKEKPDQSVTSEGQKL